MKACKYLKLLSAFCGIVCLALYVDIFFHEISVINYDSMLILLFSAEALLLLAILFLVCAVLVKHDILDTSKIKKILAVFVPVIAVGCLSFIVYGSLSYYSYYTPEKLFENEKSYMQSFFPYHDLEAKQGQLKGFEVSHIPGTTYISLYSYGMSTAGHRLDYEAEYYKSVSPFMYGNFRLERTYLTPMNVFDLDVHAPGKKMKVDGKTVTVFEDSTGYAVLVHSFNEVIYVSLLNVWEGDTTIEDFAREAIRQLELLGTATKEKVFFDVPLSEAF